jgi:UDP-N-acetylmuramoyl-L-alanyl-D-glutamate--2,6-diaminopimelate ligase
MAEAAWTLAGDPQDRLRLVGVTGTNGKTTTAHLVGRMLEAAGTGCGTFGTLGYRLPGNEVRPAQRTTPEATDLAPLLAAVVEGGGRAAVMEVSSHALMLDRLAGLSLQVAVWTNLSHDHLDYHRTMDRYFAAKRRLFTDLLAGDGRRVLPVDDEWASRLLTEPRPGDISWGLEDGDVHARHVRASLDGTDFTLVLPAAEIGVHLALLGEFNLRNALTAAAAGHALGLAPETLKTALEGAQPLCGRLQRVATDLAFPIFVDYAHTPEALRSVISALRALSDRRLIVVFGAGGDRDTAKRAPMGRAVGELADVPIVTSDNPRTEDPQAIADAVADGVRAAGAEPTVVVDRRQAIAHGLDIADQGALVLVAGKGHEATQTIGHTQLPFVDQEVIVELAGRCRCS